MSPVDNTQSVSVLATAPSPSSYRAALGLLMMLLLCPCFVSLYNRFVGDPDIWWHLSAGQWIFQHRAIPHSDFFSWTLPGSQWHDYSWLFDLCVYGIVRLTGLLGIVLIPSFFLVVFSANFYLQMEDLQADFTIRVILALFGLFCMFALYTPRPWLISILLFQWIWRRLLRARKGNAIRTLWVLPIFFAVWANCHIQFVNGLIFFAIFCIEPLWYSFSKASETQCRLPKTAAFIWLSCVFATFINPFGWRIYQDAFALGSQQKVLNLISEMQAMPFRHMGNYLLVLLILSLALLLGYRRQFGFLNITCVLLATFLALRSQRDVWMAAVIVTAFLAENIEFASAVNFSIRRSSWMWVGLCCVIALLLPVSLLALHASQLTSKVQETFPLKSLQCLKQRRMSGNIFNDYAWGGFLTWYTDSRVSIDGRAAFYGDDRIVQSMNTWTGKSGWNNDPALKQAPIILANKDSALTQLLRKETEYSMVCADAVSEAWVRHPSPQSITQWRGKRPDLQIDP